MTFKVNPFVSVIDIETGSTRINAHIFSVGIVTGNVLTGEIIDECYLRLSKDGQENRIMDDDTMQHFWGNNDKVCEKARKEIFDQSIMRHPLRKGLELTNDYFYNLKDPETPSERLTSMVVGNGPEFDNAILNEAMADNALRPAWKFWTNQSLRTAVWMGRLLLGKDPKYEMQFEGIPHHALHDARHEFKYLCEIFKQFTLALNAGVGETIVKK